MSPAPVAQLDRALPSEGRGHWFESSRVHQTSFIPLYGQCLTRIFGQSCRKVSQKLVGGGVGKRALVSRRGVPGDLAVGCVTGPRLDLAIGAARVPSNSASLPRRTTGGTCCRSPLPRTACRTR